jgi:glycosyltransferase involved in cell wall biosynthesis
MLTVIIATYNRSYLLKKTLDALTLIDTPRGGWKLVVVNNACTDNTSEVISSFTKKLPIQLIEEAGKGKSRALNKGLRYLKGDLVVFTDDDVLACKSWLVELRIAADTHPGFDIFGGTILAADESRPYIHNFSEQKFLEANFALSDPYWKEGPIIPEYVWGPNMAVRAELFRSGHLFSEVFDPQKKRIPKGLETEFLKRVCQLGHKCWHCKKAAVKHIISPSQTSLQYLLNRAHKFGRQEFHIKSFDYKGGTGNSFIVFIALLREGAGRVKRCIFNKNIALKQKTVLLLWEAKKFEGVVCETIKSASKSRT